MHVRNGFRRRGGTDSRRTASRPAGAPTPCDTTMNTMTKEELMKEAIALSVTNVARGGGPFGAVIAREGKIVATGANRVTADNDPTAHAEVNAKRST